MEKRLQKFSKREERRLVGWSLIAGRITSKERPPKNRRNKLVKAKIAKVKSI